MRKFINLCYSVIIGAGLVTAALVWQAATTSPVIEFPPLPENADIVNRQIGICPSSAALFIYMYAVGEEVFRVEIKSQADELLVVQLYDKAGDLVGVWIKTRAGIRHYPTMEEVKADFNSPCDVYDRLHPKGTI